MMREQIFRRPLIILHILVRFLEQARDIIRYDDNTTDFLPVLTT